MNYQKIYDDLIAKRIANPLSNKDKGHRHHIKPKRLFPDLVTNPNNIVKLTYKEHFIAHLLYAKICQQKFGENSLEYRLMHHVVHRMCHTTNFPYKITGKIFQKICQEHVRLFTIWRNTVGKVPWNKGRHDLPPSWNKGRKGGKTWNKGLKGQGAGVICVNNGIKTIRVKPNEIPIGFVKGRAPLPIESKLKASGKGMIYICNFQLQKTKRIFLSELQKYVDDGWIRGQLQTKLKILG